MYTIIIIFYVMNKWDKTKRNAWFYHWDNHMPFATVCFANAFYFTTVLLKIQIIRIDVTSSECLVNIPEVSRNEFTEGDDNSQNVANLR